MRIISKQRDYYDSVQKHVSDDPNVFVRMESEKRLEVHELPSSVNDKMQDFWKATPNQTRPFELETIMIGFCGKMYPALHVRYTKPKWLDYKTDTFYTIEQYRKFIDEVIKDKKFSEYYYKKRKSIYGWRRWDDTDDYISRYLNKWSGTDVFEDLFFELKTPIFALKHEKNNFRVSNYAPMSGFFNFYINIPLIEYNFHKVFDTYSAYQEIDMYYFGVLGCTEKDTVTISDLDMRNQKGFDKMSFKKYPTKKR